MEALDVAGSLSLLAPLLAAGTLAGTMAGLLGVGGGMIVVPVLLYTFGLIGVAEAQQMHLAIGTSLATIVVTSVMSARSHHRRGSVAVPILRSWLPWLVLGVAGGAVAAAMLDGSALKIVFGTVALAVGGYMALTRAESALAKAPPHGAARGVVATGIGGLSTLIGIGGGTFTVPTLVLSSVPAKVAVGTAAAVGLIIALPGALAFVLAGWGRSDLPPLSLGYVNLVAFAALIPMTGLFAPLGARLAHRLSPIWLRRAFASFLLVNGANILRVGLM